MIDRLRVHALDEAKVVRDARRVRHELADPGAALAVAREAKDRAGQGDRRLIHGHAGQALAAADVLGKLLAVLLVEQRLVIEKILLRGAAALKEIDDALGLGGEVRRTEHPGGSLGLAAHFPW